MGRLDRIDAFFRAEVAAKRLPGAVVMIARDGQVVYHEAFGLRDPANGAAMAKDSIFRIYSMTKPVTAVAVLMLMEEGKLRLADPASRFLPALRSPKVLVQNKDAPGQTTLVPAEREINFRDLLTHTSGLTYGFMESNPVDAAYRAKEGGVDFQTADTSLKQLVERLAQLPLIAQPGKAWNYSVSTDVLGYLVEVISGQPFEKYLKEKVIDPLRMVDTDFHVPADKHDRFAANYSAGAGGKLDLIDDPGKSRYLAPRKVNSGGGGLVSTASDYLRFCKFMLNKGELDGVRLLGRKTVELMTMNHLKGDMADMGTPRFSESTYTGIGFGLGFSVMIDPAKAFIAGTPGEYAWGGAASTAFWIDPKEDMAVVLLTQLMPSSTYPIRRELRVLTYQAIID